MWWYRLWLIPELGLLSKKEDREWVYRQVAGPGRLPRLIGAGIASFFLGAWFWGYAILCWSSTQSLWAFLACNAPIFICIQISSGLGGVVVRGGLRRKARMFLADRFGCRICVPCGYDLTGNASGVCPECDATVPKWTAFDAKRNKEMDPAAQE